MFHNHLTWGERVRGKRRGEVEGRERGEGKGKERRGGEGKERGEGGMDRSSIRSKQCTKCSSVVNISHCLRRFTQ